MPPQIHRRRQPRRRRRRQEDRRRQFPRAVSARLNDARFFWDNDRKIKLEDRFEKLGQIVFHEKLGTVKDKAERVMALAKELAPKVGADPAQAERAAKLAKCDLVSDMVGEFAELEGVMGRYYATLQKEPQAIADAVRDHYKPKGPGDQVPGNPVGDRCGARGQARHVGRLLGDRRKADGLEGSVRASSCGAGRRSNSCWKSNIRLPLQRDSLWCSLRGRACPTQEQMPFSEFEHILTKYADTSVIRSKYRSDRQGLMENKRSSGGMSTNLLSFFADRLKVHLREQGARHDLIDAVFALGEDDLVLIVKRVEALGAVPRHRGRQEPARGLQARRQHPRHRGEEGRQELFRRGQAMPGDPPEVERPARALEKAAPEASAALEKEDFAGAMKALSKLRGPVDAFFDKVTVNADKPDVRENRLKLLSQIRDALNRVADFSEDRGLKCRIVHLSFRPKRQARRAGTQGRRGAGSCMRPLGSG